MCLQDLTRQDPGVLLHSIAFCRPAFYIGERDNDFDVAESLFDQDSMWLVRPQLFFHCTLRPIGTVAGRYNRSYEDIPLDLVSSVPLRNFA